MANGGVNRMKAEGEMVRGKKKQKHMNGRGSKAKEKP